MGSWKLVCPRCGWEGGSEEYFHKCPRCGSPLAIKGALPRPPRSLLGEGNTPLVKINGIRYKLEYVNPTGSFKDRGASLSVWLAHELGYDCVVEDSSGNTAVAVAAFASRLGLRARVHIPSTASRGKVSLMKLLGADIVVHDSRAAASAAAEKEARQCYYVAHIYSPVFVEGTASIAEELAKDGVVWPVLLPVSSGTLLLGLAWGFGKLGVRPRLIAVQSPEAASLAGRVPILAKVGDNRGKLLDALVVKEPPRLEEIARHADGLVVVGDSAALKAMIKLGRMGFIVEPSSATVFAALEALGLKEATLLLTGSGLKYAEALLEWIRG